MQELHAALYVLPRQERMSHSREAQAIMEQMEAVYKEAEALCPPPPLPTGFRWGFPEMGEAVFGFRILPCTSAHPDLWGAIMTFEDAEEVLSPYNLEVRPNMGDFVVIVKGTNLARYLVHRIRLVGPPGSFHRVAHLFSR